MKTALILETKSSGSKFKNGSTIRQKLIEQILQKEGYSTFKYSEKISNIGGSWDVIVTFSPRRIGLVNKLSNNQSRVWMDFCDSWVYSRFSWTTGPRLVLIGLVDLFFVISKRRHFEDCLITYISLYDMEKDRRLLKFLRVFRVEILGNAQKSTKISSGYSGERRLVFVGDGKYFPNLLAVLELSLLIMPRLVKKIPHKKIYLLGGGWANWISYLPNLSFVGFTNESLMYTEIDVHLAPLRQRAGVKNKVAIPLSLGIPVVAYRQALNGIGSSDNLFVANSVRDFEGQIIKALKNGKTDLSKASLAQSSHELNPNILNWIRN